MSAGRPPGRRRRLPVSDAFGASLAIELTHSGFGLIVAMMAT